MNETQIRQLITETGRQLLADGLVARTWGNVSARLDAVHFLITPSGLDYMQTKEVDLAKYNPQDKTWEGPHKPSSEKGIHAAAYDIFPEVTFVIHTHQTYASAMGVWDFEHLKITDEERRTLGGVALASYGLPGTKKLKKAVTSAFETGAHTVLMKHHGVVVAGSSKEEAYQRALLLEQICKRQICGTDTTEQQLDEEQTRKKDTILLDIQRNYPGARWVETDAAIRWSQKGKALFAQLDDMAQMIGKAIHCVGAEGLVVNNAFVTGANAVFVEGLGAVVMGRDADDTDALQILVDKAAVSALHSYNATGKTRLSGFDCALMHFVYQKKYSKQKNG